MTTTKPTSAIDESAEQLAERLLPCTQEDSIDASGNYVGHDGYCPAYYRADVATALRAERERALEATQRDVDRLWWALDHFYRGDPSHDTHEEMEAAYRRIAALAQKGGNK